ncbi:MAG: LON peptidase substrate-binding domain-containing protein [Spirosomataceae bacterium]
MQKFLPLFPLNLVAYPQEDLNLHIFEPRYRQLINECLSEQKTFGIPPFINNRLLGYGTEMVVKRLVRRHEDGRMDIETRGIGLFRIVDFQNPVPQKLYAGAEVVLVEHFNEVPMEVMPGLLERLKRLYQLIQVPFSFNTADPLFSFQVAHKIGLSVEEEYELLTISSETHRQAFLMKHLEKTLPVITEMERTKERIRMNGHFKNLDPLNF